MSTTTTLPATVPSVTELKARFQSLQERATTVGLGLQELVPMNGRLQEAQEAFMQSISNLNILEGLFEEGQKRLTGVVIVFSTKEEIEADGGIVEELAEMAKAIGEALTEEFGVSEAAIHATMIPDLVQYLDLLELVIKRSEESFAIASK